jgi:hypothetical protein
LAADGCKVVIADRQEAQKTAGRSARPREGNRREVDVGQEASPEMMKQAWPNTARSIFF